jgi:hypothetical protein
MAVPTTLYGSETSAKDRIIRKVQAEEFKFLRNVKVRAKLSKIKEGYIKELSRPTFFSRYKNKLPQRKVITLLLKEQKMIEI